MRKAFNKVDDDMQIDSALFNPDELWKRPQVRGLRLVHTQCYQRECVTLSESDGTIRCVLGSFNVQKHLDKIVIVLLIVCVSGSLVKVCTHICNSCSQAIMIIVRKRPRSNLFRRKKNQISNSGFKNLKCWYTYCTFVAAQVWLVHLYFRRVNCRSERSTNSASSCRRSNRNRI